MNANDYDKQVAVFERSLKWYVDAHLNPADEYFAKILVQYFVPTIELSRDLLEVVFKEIVLVKK